MGSAAPLALETLDFGKFLDGTESERQEIADSLVRSLTQHGFTKLVNHEVSDEIVEGIWYWVRHSSTGSDAELQSMLTCRTQRRAKSFSP